MWIKTRLPKGFRLPYNSDKLEVHMAMTGNESLTSNPYYFVGTTGLSRGYMPATRFAVKKRLVGFTVDRYFFDFSEKGNVPIGFAFTEKGADKVAHKAAMELAQRLAERYVTTYHDMREQDIKALFEPLADHGFPNPKDADGRPIRDKFYPTEPSLEK